MAVLCCVAAFIGYDLNWIRQRQAFRKQPKLTFIESPVHSGTTLRTRAPQLLWLFGESGTGFITVEVLEEDLQHSGHGSGKLKATPRMNVIRAHALFPEATIYATDESGDVVENLNWYWQFPGKWVGEE